MGLFQSCDTNDECTKQFSGRFLVGSAETIPSEELVDTTGSGDAFIGAVLYCMYQHINKSLSHQKLISLH